MLIMKKIQLLLIVCFFAGMLHAQTWTAPVPAGSTVVSGTGYYVYNIGAKAFLKRGGDWTSQAVVFPGEGSLITPVLASSLWTLQYENSASRLLNCNISSGNVAGSIYTDGTSNDGTLTNTQYNLTGPAVDNSYSIQVRSTFAPYNAYQFVGAASVVETAANGGSAQIYPVRYNIASSDYTKWIFCTAAEVAKYNARVKLDKYMKIAKLVGSAIDLTSYITTYNSGTTTDINTATTSLITALSPTDKTSTMTNPSFYTGTNNYTGWTATGTAPTANNSEVEYYGKIGGLNQTISSLPAGIYILKVQGYERPSNLAAIDETWYANGWDSRSSYFYATASGTTTTYPFRSMYSETTSTSSSGTKYTGGTIYYPNTMAQAQTGFTAGLYDNESPYFAVDATGSATIGMNSCFKSNYTKQSQWLVADNFRLYYYGGFAVASVSDLSAFQTTIDNYQAICTAAVTGNSPGQYPSAAITAFQAAITTAQGVHDQSNVTYNAVLSATPTLDNAYNTFLTNKEGTQVNKDALATALATATALYNGSTEGNAVGQFSAANRTTFNTARTAAQTVYDAQNSNDIQLTAALGPLNTAILAFKNSLIVNTNYLADGYYYIYTSNSGTDYYLSDVSPYTMPAMANSYSAKYEPKNTGSSLKYQEFKLTYDATKGRYKIEGKYRLDNPSIYKNSSTSEVQSYVSENGAFGGNVYANAWNTMSLKYDGTHFAIQKGESAGTDYWKPASYAVDALNSTNPSASTGLTDNVIYSIVSATRSAGEASAFNTNITDATTAATNVSGDASGKYTAANVSTMNTAISAASTIYNLATATSSDVAAAQDALASAKSTFLASVNQTFTGTGNWSETGKWSAGFLPATTANTYLAAGADLTIDNDATIAKLTVGSTSKATVASGKKLSTAALTIQSDATGTGTFVNNGTPSLITATIQQYVASGRNWYVSSPVSNATGVAIGSINTSTGTYLAKYDEPHGTSAPWVTETDSLKAGVGYIVAAPSNTNPTIEFAGILNDGDKNLSLTRTSGQTKEGFNLIGNPYASYVDWNSAVKTNVEPTIWYRTRNTAMTPAYVFDTYNATSQLGTNNNLSGEVTGFIPPMQAVWTRVSTGQSSGSVLFSNSMRSHASGTTTKLKAARVMQVIRLQVSANGNSDEAILAFSPDASNGLDAFDSYKMSNGNALVPEIFTQVGTQELAINGMAEPVSGKVLALGFRTGQKGAFTLKAKSLVNLEEGTKLQLLDKLTGVQSDLSDGSDYAFVSDIATTLDRFSLIIGSANQSTGIDQLSASNAVAYRTTDNRIAIELSAEAAQHATATVYDLAGRRLASQKLTGTSNVLDVELSSGTYMVVIGTAQKSFLSKVVLR
jgi:hypothetical protein